MLVPSRRLAIDHQDARWHTEAGVRRGPVSASEPRPQRGRVLGSRRARSRALATFGVGASSPRPSRINRRDRLPTRADAMPLRSGGDLVATVAEPAPAARTPPRFPAPESTSRVTVAQEHQPGAVDSRSAARGRRRSKVLVARNRLQRSTLGPLARSARGTIVQSLSAEADALPDCPKQKDLQIQAFSEAAEGIRTLDLLHGKQNVYGRFAHEKPCKPPGSLTAGADSDSPAFTGKPRGFGHPTGTRAA